MTDTPQIIPAPTATQEYSNSWIVVNWRALCGLAYVVICLTDFVMMPLFYEITNLKYTPERILSLASTFKESATQIEAIHVLHNQRTWSPITLSQNGLFHMAFAGILGVAAWTHGREAIAFTNAPTDPTNPAKS